MRDWKYYFLWSDKMEKPEFKLNSEWYRFSDKLEADNPNNRLIWFNDNRLDISDDTLRIILNPRFIVRYEPDWFENAIIFDADSSKTISINETAFEIIHEISQERTTFSELSSKFDSIPKDILKGFLSQLSNKEIIKVVNENTISKYLLNNLVIKKKKSLKKNVFKIPYPSAPYNVTIYPTYFCNFSCLHCGVIPSEKNKIISFEQWKKIIDDLINNGVVEIKIMGGEPLTHPEIFSMIDYLIDKPVRVKLCTNGYLLSDHLLEKILISNNIDLLLSLDGGTKEIHDKMRSFPGAFNKMIHILTDAKRLKGSKKIVLTSVISKLNEKEFEKIIDLAYKFEIKHLAFVFTYHVGKCRNNNEHYTNYYKNRKLPYKIMDYSKKYLNELSVSVQGTGPNENNIKESINEFFGHEIICNAGNISCMIDPLGNVYPCDILSTIIPVIRKKYIIGNALTEGFLTLWNSENFLPFRGGYKNENLKYCNDCKYNEFCGQKKCRLYALSSTDDYDGKAYECNFIES
jgi:radical SAM protein with 4Fe4S-binding SPASM domain